jgi:predicted DCC family thiol-disulfide oxidoreductase YuxK
MVNGWTGGQYSTYRIVLAAAFAAHFGVGGAIVAVPLALGIADRLVAVVCAGYLVAVALFADAPSVLLVAAAALALHFATPGRPYGSWGARKRADPGSGWWLPARTQLAARGLLAGVLLLDAVGKVESPGALWAPLLLLAFDPAWVPAKRAGAPVRLFYDGECGLCHGAVRFVLAEDRDGQGFRFAPLASESFAGAVSAERRATLPDSIVLALQDGTLRVRSAATLEIGERLGGLWRLFARAARLLPEAWLDRGYDAIARNRKRFVRRPDDACPVVSAELRARFD